ncbi:unnamed protein product [Rotaria sp. Silwood2]|nr:unnamed protein product [Rotaria sp. Silwood2]CAF3033037.1 unnamed protein product [Rotaria sp. Silwood2]CAF3387029.1 unnamed protein product [Rotaria sp. Silwood2]CAF4301773.1 unnamed protein product [Rotaria sp. Silwood2]CAF4427262.1 unnamed protein product [Rotaria sp. Silwood2]
MSREIKQRIISIIPLYLSKECPAYSELIKAIEDIPDDKFDQVINEPLLSINQRIHYLLDEILFFINQHYPITQEQGVQLDRFINEIKTICIDLIKNNEKLKNDIERLESRIESLESDRSETKESIKCLENNIVETKRRRTIAELLTPFVKEIRTVMINQHVPDYYYSKSIINACLLRSQGQSISWEVADFNRDNRQTNFDINIFHDFELIIKNQTDSLRINYDTLLEFLLDKMDRNEAEHDTVKTFLRYNSHGNTSFNEYLSSIGIPDAFDMNQKLCLESLYRNHFAAYYHAL